MSDGEESEYELNTLCEKITAVLTEQEWYNKNRSVSKAFSSIIKKVKVNQYLSFDLFLSDVKSIFTVLRQDANHSTALDACEQAIAKELHSLIKMDYFAAGAESDTSANSSVVPVVPVVEGDKKVEKETPSPTKSRKKRSSAVAGKTGKGETGKVESPNAKTPVKQSPAKEKIKISLKPAVQKESAAFDFDQTSTRVQQICTNFVKKIRGKPSVAVIFSKLPTKADLPDYYEDPDSLECAGEGCNDFCCGCNSCGESDLKCDWIECAIAIAKCVDACCEGSCLSSSSCIGCLGSSYETCKDCWSESEGERFRNLVMKGVRSNTA